MNIRKLVKKIGKRYFLVLIILGLFMLSISVTYSLFRKNYDGFQVSEMYISELVYGIKINNVSTKTITSAASSGEVRYIVEITSVNEIDSWYKLGYITTNNDVLVQVTNSSEWRSAGYINAYGENVYSKEIDIVVTNNTASAATIIFDAFGGYPSYELEDFNMQESYLELGSYVETYTTILNNASTLTEIIDDELECTPTENSPCFYKNELENNYVTLNGSNWRMLGTYLINGVEVVKIIQDTNNSNSQTYSSADSNMASVMQNIIDNGYESYVYETTCFDCAKQGSVFSCSDQSSYTDNIAPITKDEYDEISELFSYLTPPSNSYWTMTEAGISAYETTSRGLNTKTRENTSGVRGTIYLNPDVRRNEGNGSSSSPFTLTLSADVILKWNYIGTAHTVSSFPTKAEANANSIVVDTIECITNSGQAIEASWDPTLWAATTEIYGSRVECQVTLDDEGAFSPETMTFKKTNSSGTAFSPRTSLTSEGVWINTDVYMTVNHSIADLSSVVTIYNDSGNVVSLSSGILTTTTGMYTIVVQTTSASLGITKIRYYYLDIDKTDPTCTLSSVAGQSCANIYFAPSDADSGIPFEKSKWPGDTRFDTLQSKCLTAGTHTVYVQDKAGNQGSCTRTVTQKTVTQNTTTYTCAIAASSSTGYVTSGTCVCRFLNSYFAPVSVNISCKGKGLTSSSACQSHCQALYVSYYLSYSSSCKRTSSTTYSCGYGTLNGTICYLYYQPSCPGGWSTVGSQTTTNTQYTYFE